MKKLGLWIAVIFGVLFLIGLCTSLTTTHQSGTSASSSSSSSTRSSVGDKGVLYSGSELVPVAASERSLDEWTKASVAKDEYGRTSLLASGGIFAVKSGTPVLVIDRSMFTRKIRILKGDYKGQAGWVPYEYVKQG